MVHQRFVFRIRSGGVEHHHPASIGVLHNRFGIAALLNDFHPEDIGKNGKGLLKTAAFVVTFDELGFFSMEPHSRTFGATCSIKRRIDARAWSSVKPPSAKFPARSVRKRRSLTYSTLSRTSSELPTSTRFWSTSSL